MQTSNNLQEWFGGIDIYLFDQLLKGRIVPGMRVLDAGCGAGRNLVHFLRSGYEVFGVDESAPQIAQIRKMASALAPHLPAENFWVGSVERLSAEYPDQETDGRRQEADGRRQTAGNGSLTERLSADFADQETDGRRQEADGRRQTAGNGSVTDRLSADFADQETDGRRQEADGRKQTAGNGSVTERLSADYAEQKEAGRMSSTPRGLPAWGPRPALPDFHVVLSSAVLHFARDEDQWQAMVNEMWRVLKPGGMLFARLASTIGVEDQIELIEGRRYHLPDGSDRFLVDADMLKRVTAALGGEFLEPIKTTVVENMRAMTTWVVRK